MKNLLKKIFSLLIALTILLSGISAIADDGDEANEATVLTLEVGKGISGTLQPDSATEIRAYAGRSGEVRFTLTLTDDCGPAITVNGSSVSVARQNDSLPVYTFTMLFAGGESKTILLTANALSGYSMISEMIPEETETKPEEPAPIPAPATDPAEEAIEETTEEAAEEATEETIEETEEKTNPEGETGPETQEPEATETETAEEPAAEAAEAPEDGTMIETTVPEEETAPELQDPAVTDEEGKEELKEEPMEGLAEESVEEPTKEVAEPAEEIKSETESGEYEQLAEPESIPEAEGTGNQQTEELPEGQEAEQQTESEEQEPKQQITEEQEAEQPKTENSEAAADSVEIIIAKSLTPDESWKGTVRKTKPTILKLDVADSRMIHLFVEGKDVLYSVQKSDRITEDAGYVLTDSATNHSVTSWAAEPGSYLISIRAGENSMGARVTISFKNDEEFATWEEEQAALEAEPQGKEKENIPEENGEEPKEAGTESETEKDLLPRRSVSMVINWDTDDPVLGDTAHMKAILEGYDGLSYSLQWQNSPDCETWKDISGATGETFDIRITEENNDLYWRILVYLETSVDGEEE